MSAADTSRPGLAGVAYDETVQRACDLVSVLRSRAAQTKAAAVMLPETVSDLQAMGALRILQPRR